MVNLSKGFDQVSDNGFVPGSLKFLNSTSSLELSEDRPVQSSSSPCKSSFSQASSPRSVSNRPPPCFEVINRTRRLGGCTRCLGLNHSKASCRAQFRCVACFNYGHKFKFCLTRSRPVIAWKPKVVPQSERPISECERVSPSIAPSESQRAGVTVFRPQIARVLQKTPPLPPLPLPKNSFPLPALLPPPPLSLQSA
jgi:hypothetical protein